MGRRKGTVGQRVEHCKTRFSGHLIRRLRKRRQCERHYSEASWGPMIRELCGGHVAAQNSGYAAGTVYGILKWQDAGCRGNWSDWEVYYKMNEKVGWLDGLTCTRHALGGVDWSLPRELVLSIGLIDLYSRRAAQ